MWLAEPSLECVLSRTLPAVSLAAVPGRRRATLDLAIEIEKQGFSGIYCPSFGDAVGLCHGIAAETENIPFGTSIVNIYTRHVEDFAASAAFISEISGKRFRFGVGVSHAPMNKKLGVSTGKPLSDMRAFVEEYKAASRTGDLPPLVLAAMRDRMMALGAEVADGVVLANGARSALPAAIDRMRSAHTIPEDFFIGGMIPTCISNDRDAAMEVNRRTLTMYVQLPNYRNYWKAAGYTNEMAAIEEAIAEGDRAQLPALMTEQWLADVSLFGSHNEVLDGLEAWYEAGLTTPILVPSSTSGGQFQAFNELFELFG